MTIVMAGDERAREAAASTLVQTWREVKVYGTRRRAMVLREWHPWFFDKVTAERLASEHAATARADLIRALMWCQAWPYAPFEEPPAIEMEHNDAVSFVAGTIWTRASCVLEDDAPVAQTAERCTRKAEAAGSTPAGGSHGE